MWSGGGGGRRCRWAVRRQIVKSGLVKVKLVDAAKNHYYQPIWTLVGGGLYDFEKSAKATKNLIPQGVDHIKVFVCLKFRSQYRKIYIATLTNNDKINRTNFTTLNFNINLRWFVEGWVWKKMKSQILGRVQ